MATGHRIIFGNMDRRIGAANDAWCQRVINRQFGGAGNGACHRVGKGQPGKSGAAGDKAAARGHAPFQLGIWGKSGHVIRHVRVVGFLNVQ